ncbi:MAG: energy-coupling factor transporter transmembrane protein EcfT [Treponema sp.]|nr:energy-coupling factor transporter transmembrane protein EcfT [Treponema sp.]MCL2237618.1 energy-coupling factor transporter transmembrane protein EcfT [Treponema sp.]
MVGRNAIFQYKTVNGPLHKVPAIIKLILLLPLSILVFYLPALWLCFGFFILMALAFIGGITFTEQLRDLKPAIIYTVFMYTLSVFSNLFLYYETTAIPMDIPLLYFILTPNDYFLRFAIRLTIIIQISALVFRTTSSLEIRNAVRIEAIYLFLGFIPEIFKIWTSIDTAWKARRGKNGIKKIKTLLYVLISLSFEKAAIKSKALESRRNSNDK